MRFRGLLTSFLLLILFLIGVHGNQKKESKKYRDRRKYCETVTCVAVGDDDPNCELKCISEACWDEWFGQNPLEPGEFDTPRNQKFITCAKKEMVAIEKAEKAARRARAKLDAAL